MAQLDTGLLLRGTGFESSSEICQKQLQIQQQDFLFPLLSLRKVSVNKGWTLTQARLPEASYFWVGPKSLHNGWSCEPVFFPPEL